MGEFVLLVIAGLTAACAIATVVTQNIVRCATWLLFTLAGAAGIFFLLGADLVGAVQLLVYVGGTLVLVVFGVMLTAQGPFITMKTSSAEWAISATVGLLLITVLGFAVYSLRDIGPPFPRPLPRGIASDEFRREFYLLLDDAKQRGRLSKDPASAPYSAVIGQGFIGAPVGPPHYELPAGLPVVVRTHYLLPFEIVSVHLLVVLIGAAYLARAKRRKGADQPVVPREKAQGVAS
jgi:NADH-quinone oxidoreductase subunit J